MSLAALNVSARLTLRASAAAPHDLAWRRPLQARVRRSDLGYSMLRKIVVEVCDLLRILSRPSMSPAFCLRRDLRIISRASHLYTVVHPSACGLPLSRERRL